MGKRRRQTHNLAGDQFGEYDEPRDEFGAGGGANKAGGAGRGGGGGGGGGTAGGSGPRGAVALAPREVPKFLQAYAHLLPSGGGGGAARGGEDGPLVVGGEDGDNSGGKHARRPDRPSDDDDDEDEGQDPVEAEAIARALEDNPELAAELDKGGNKDSAASRQLRRARAAAEKERGNDAFKDGRHAEAARHFSAAIELFPEEAVFWSNRAAARAALGEHEGALADARKAAELKPSWHKAHARVGAALEALGCPDEAEEAYRRALDLEPADAGLRQSIERAAAAARKLKQQGVVFKKKGGAGGGGGGGAGGGAGGGVKPAAPVAPPPWAAAGVKAKGLLSFGDDDEEEEEE